MLMLLINLIRSCLSNFFPLFDSFATIEPMATSSLPSSLSSSPSAKEHRNKSLATIEPRLLIHPSTVASSSIMTTSSTSGIGMKKKQEQTSNGTDRHALDTLSIGQQLKWLRVFQHWPSLCLDTIAAYAKTDTLMILAGCDQHSVIMTLSLPTIININTNINTGSNVIQHERKNKWQQLPMTLQTQYDWYGSGILDNQLTIIHGITQDSFPLSFRYMYVLTCASLIMNRGSTQI
jgi:hypothetical protein